AVPSPARHERPRGLGRSRRPARTAARLRDVEPAAMAADLGCDSLFYLPLEAIARCIGLDNSQLCRACLTGKYPTPTGEQRYQLSLRNRTSNTNGRTYEVPTHVHS